MDARTVLVVEEDVGVRGLLVELLDTVGYAVLQADRGWTGLRMAEEHVPAVVLVDHVLPDMSGLDMLEQLRRRRTTRRLPVVLVSGRSQQLEGRAHGADQVLPMPFDIDVLLAHVEQLALPSEDALA